MVEISECFTFDMMIALFLEYLLFPLTFLYRFLFWWDKKRTKAVKLDNSIVWSVGNLSVGGTGKTPFTLYLIDLALKNIGLEIYVLSRGYGGNKSNEGMEVLPTSKPENSGDEPFLIKKNYPESRVLIGKNRSKSFEKFATKSEALKFVILDDGFQHHAITRDHDFVLIDAENGLGNGRVFPSGKLRESEEALSRANSVVFTKVKDVNRYKVNAIKDKLEKKYTHLDFYYFNYLPVCFTNLMGQTLSLEEMKYRDVYLFSGIANPESFRDTVKPYCRTILGERIFPDHYNYTETDLANLYSELKSGTVLLCTEKDFVKLTHLQNIHKYSGIYYMVMKGSLEEEQLFISKLLSKVTVNTP
jgi:tetraacyldisaccharide 4'-kinase